MINMMRSYIGGLAGIVLLFLSGIFPLQTFAINASISINKIETYESWYPQVAAFITLIDENRQPLRELNQSMLRIWEGNEEIENFTILRVQETGAFIYLLLDVSGSMRQGNKLSDAKTAAISFINNMQTNDQTALLGFDSEMHLLSEFTNDKASLVNLVKTLIPLKDTRLYDAIDMAVSRCRDLPLGLKAIVVLTDGKDEGSLRTINDVIEKAQQEFIPIFTIGFGSKDTIDRSSLEAIAIRTSGSYEMVSSLKELLVLYQSIWDRLHNQLIVRYNTHYPSDGKSYEVKIGINYRNQLFTAAYTFNMPLLASSQWDTVFVLLIVMCIVGVFLASILYYYYKNKLMERNNQTYGASNTRIRRAEAHSEEEIEYQKDFNSGDEVVPSEKEYIPHFDSTGEPSFQNSISDGNNIPYPELRSIHDWEVIGDGTAVHLGYLFQKNGLRRGAWFQLTDLGKTVIGSNAPKSNCVIENDDRISEDHAAIYYKSDADAYFISDLVSATGTHVNGENIKEKRLDDGDVIRVGGIELVFKTVNI